MALLLNVGDTVSRSYSYTQPSPLHPIQPQECGDLETTGTYTGQYKIPILNNSQTTNVYLGEVETTRKIKKLVLTGEEDWWYSSGYLRFEITLTDILAYGNRETTIVCSHYQCIDDGRSITDVPDKSCYIGTTDIAKLFIKDIDYTSAADFKTYLQQQYTAGTPVTVWYVLATPQTAVVNEPLRKIGDYADEVSSITIPTIAGANTISVGTTLLPSEVSVNYKGWHTVQSVHEKSMNLLNEAEPPQNIYITDSIKRMGYEVEVTAGTYTAYGDNSDLYAKTKINGIYGDAVQINNSQNLTLNSDGIIIIYSRVIGEFPDTNIMLNSGSTALPYEPYWA